jgi:ABC transport system ATP-binding/permease protein
MAELLLSCQEISKSFGAAPLFEGLSLAIAEGDHVGVVGPNGSGKSTLLRILADLEEPSSGVRSSRRRLRIGYVEQDPRFPDGATVESVLRASLARSAVDPADHEGRLAISMGKAGLSAGEQAASTLSGGWKKRLAIARELVGDLDLLLLDEPTNHLDIDGILWLEALLVRETEAFVAVSHDRYFLEAVAGRMIEINRAFASGLLDLRGRYSEYLVKKDDILAAQASYQESLRNRVRGEIEWLSRKAKARTRKAQARIDSAGRMIGELKDLDLRSRTETAGIEFADTKRRTRRLVVAKGLKKAYGVRTMLNGLDLVMSPGMRLGLLGGNGSGKSTLLRLLAGREQPDSGTVTHAEKLQVVVFDQHRERLDPAVSLARTLAPFGDSVIHEGRSIHVGGWARRFLFRSDQLDTPVGRLSGGEQARVLIAKLMLEPADLLMLDEPTNDLDIPTLEVLEESLLEFGGALVLVTHDRYLLDRVSTSLLALDGAGGAEPFADYAQWEATRTAAARQAATAAAGRSGPARAAAAPKAMRLTYNEQREWNQMEQRIHHAEAALAQRAEAAADPAIATNYTLLAERHAAEAAARAEVDRLYARWAELEDKVKAVGARP